MPAASQACGLEASIYICARLPGCEPVLDARHWAPGLNLWRRSAQKNGGLRPHQSINFDSHSARYPFICNVVG